MRPTLLALVAGLALAACDSSTPCKSCPDVTGAWKVHQGSQHGACTARGLVLYADHDEVAVVTQSGANLQVSIGAQTFGGTVFDDDRFSVAFRKTVPHNRHGHTVEETLAGSISRPTDAASTTGATFNTVTYTFSDALQDDEVMFSCAASADQSFSRTSK